jgi:hypothetical protein
MNLTIIRLSELWSALKDASAREVCDLAESYRQHGEDIGELYARHYRSLRWSDHAPYSADAAWDAIFTLSYRPFLSETQVWRGLAVFNRSLGCNVRSIPQALSVLADANDADYVRLSRDWANINGDSSAYRNLASNFRFSWEVSIPEQALDDASSLVNALIVACVSVLTVERRDRELVVDPVLMLMQMRLAKAS